MSTLYNKVEDVSVGDVVYINPSKTNNGGVGFYCDLHHKTIPTSDLVNIPFTVTGSNIWGFKLQCDRGLYVLSGMPESYLIKKLDVADIRTKILNEFNIKE